MNDSLPRSRTVVERIVRDVTARGVRMRVSEAGEGPALVLLHGLLVDHHEFDDVIDLFAERFHVIAPDLPGFGESEKPSPARYAYGIESFAEAVADLIAAFGVGRASIVGHSLGGAIGLTLAAVHAELVERLVLVAPLCHTPPKGLAHTLPLVPIVGGALFKQLFGRSLFRAHFRDHVYSPTFAPPLDRIDAYYDRFNGPAARESAAAVLRAAADTRPVVARLGLITTPTFVVWGMLDRVFLPSGASRLARDVRGARMHVLDAGHSPHEERPEEFVNLCVEFLEGRR